jgi:hypothetical protein
MWMPWEAPRRPGSMAAVAAHVGPEAEAGVVGTLFQ